MVDHLFHAALGLLVVAFGLALVRLPAQAHVHRGDPQGVTKAVDVLQSGEQVAVHRALARELARASTIPPAMEGWRRPGWRSPAPPSPHPLRKRAPPARSGPCGTCRVRETGSVGT